MILMMLVMTLVQVAFFYVFLLSSTTQIWPPDDLEPCFKVQDFSCPKNCDICDTWCDTLVICHTCLGYFVLPTFLGAIFLLRSNLRVKKILKWSLLPKGWDANPWCSWWSSSPWWLNSSLRILSFHGWIEIVLLIPAAVRRLEPPGGVKIASVTRGRS